MMIIFMETWRSVKLPGILTEVTPYPSLIKDIPNIQCNREESFTNVPVIGQYKIPYKHGSGGTRRRPSTTEVPRGSRTSSVSDDDVTPEPKVKWVTKNWVFFLRKIHPVKL